MLPPDMKKWISLAIVLYGIPALQSLAAAGKPKLVVLISIDQFRADYLARYDDLFLPAKSRKNKAGGPLGGFKYLEQNGAWFVDAHHTHFPLFTGPGHAVLLTGAHPYKTGIVGNYWFDRANSKKIYCAADPDGKIVGNSGKTKLPTVSPIELRTTTVGDELKLATGGKAKVWALGLKDRAAILMGGHLADGVIWFEEDSGNWVTSTYYATNGMLRPWLKHLNKSRRVDQFTNGVWKPEKTIGRDRVWTKAITDSHDLWGSNYQAFTFSPSGNDFVFETARRMIEEEKLGTDSTPDLLAINLSSNDYVGHTYGPDSAEVLDMTLRTDEQLSTLLNWLNNRKLLAETLVILTADHGISPLPKEMGTEAHFRQVIHFEPELEEAINDFLDSKYGIDSARYPAANVVEFNIYIDKSRLMASNVPPAEIHESVARFLESNKTNRVYAAYTREQILRGALPKTEITERVMMGYHPANSGDVVLIPEPYTIVLSKASTYQTSHGSPYAYDTSVPLLWRGPGIGKGVFTGKASTLDIAPTLSHLLGVLQPSGCEGRILSEALELKRN
jgi:predicted AlkP superfamily pyrophosphatase or phosphodiesterase